jgi:hypothetical protein
MVVAAYSRPVRPGLVFALLFAACSSAPGSGPPPIHFLHTFAPAETELVNKAIADRGLSVEASLVPFARVPVVGKESGKALHAGGLLRDGGERL